jgi:hypothetical protein
MTQPVPHEVFWEIVTIARNASVFMPFVLAMCALNLGCAIYFAHIAKKMNKHFFPPTKAEKQ